MRSQCHCKRGNQHDECRSSRDRVGEERESRIGRQALRHDARADQGCDQEAGPECSGDQVAGGISHQMVRCSRAAVEQMVLACGVSRIAIGA